MTNMHDLYKLKKEFANKYFLDSYYDILVNCEISWNNRFNGATAGVARFINKNGVIYRKIEISSKYIQYYPNQLKTVLLHEMIHIILDINERHGIKFIEQMNRINKALEIEGEENRISIKIPFNKVMPKKYKYSYLCEKCGMIYNRVKNPINIRKYVCGKCLGKLKNIKRCLNFN